MLYTLVFYRQLSRHLVGLWVTGNPTANAMLHRVLVSGRGDKREWGREKENRGEERRGRKEGGERRGIRNEREARGREEGGKRERRGEGRKREGRGQEGDEWGCLR